MRKVLVRLVLAAGLLGPATAFGQASPPTQAPAPLEVSVETKALRGKLDAFKLELDQKDAALSGRDLADADLQRLRQEVDPIWQSLREVVDELQPRLDAARARLEQLGARPKEEAAQPSADVQRERAEREAAVVEIDETQRLARALLVQAEQIGTQISDRRRSAFARALMQRSSGILSPDLWSAVYRSLPRDRAALGLLLDSWYERIRRNATPGVLLIVGLAIGLAVALYAGRRYIAPRLIHRDAAAEPTRMNRLLAALGVLAVGALPAAGGSYLVYTVLDATGLMLPRVERFVAAFLGGLAFVAFTRALAEAILAPGRPSWHLVALGDRPAERTSSFVLAISVVIAVGKVLEALNQAIAAALPLSVATKGIFALLAALTLAELLRRFATTGSEEEECFGPYLPTETDVGWPVRVLGWSAVAAVIASVLLGYVAFATFLVDQLVWIGLILATLLVAVSFGDEFTTGALGGETRIATILQANTGLRRRSLQQIALLTNGIGRIVLIIAAVMLALAPWGVNSADLLSSVRAAFFGFRVGEVTISLATVALGAPDLRRRLCGHAHRPALARHHLPAAHRPRCRPAQLDPHRLRLSRLLRRGGARASPISASASTGSRIVAGALSVGIGFGLQSIVYNFVSGLILLAERPIRVGDSSWSATRKASCAASACARPRSRPSTARADRAELQPDLRRRKNRVRTDRTGRVTISVNVLRNQDPVRAAELLAHCADVHPDVLKDPPPRVVFKKIGDTWLEFELVAYVSDVNLQQSVQSDLNFALFSCLNEAKVMPPLGPGVTAVQGLEPVREALDHIAEAIAKAPRPAGAA